MKEKIISEKEEERELPFGESSKKKKKSKQRRVNCSGQSPIPIQVYANFMRDFRHSFRHLFGVIIKGVQIGMDPDSELRYPSSPRHQ